MGIPQGRTHMTEDVNLIYSPLNRYITKDDVEIEICIYKVELDTGWCVLRLSTNLVIRHVGMFSLKLIKRR